MAASPSPAPAGPAPAGPAPAPAPRAPRRPDPSTRASLHAVVVYLAVAFLLAVCLLSRGAAGGACVALGNCNSHGTCISSNKTCVCYDGWGGPSDVAVYKAPDCSQRTCPADSAWTDVPTSANTAHATAECSNAGVCDRSTGKCVCFDGYDGDACQRTACPNDCSGHGKCVSLAVMATETNGFPIQPSTTYGGSKTTTTWDQDRIYGCVCDSVWAVGLASGETQATSWFGPDCSLRHCPSGDDPMTTAVETDCEAKKDNGAAVGVNPITGASGNKCHVDCANRGICDYSTGQCSCFDGFYGADCTLRSVLARQTARPV